MGLPAHASAGGAREPTSAEAAARQPADATCCSRPPGGRGYRDDLRGPRVAGESPASGAPSPRTDLATPPAQREYGGSRGRFVKRKVRCLIEGICEMNNV